MSFIRTCVDAVIRALRREDAGVMMTAVVALPVLVLILFGTYDFSQLLYYRTQVRAAANAAVITAIGKPSHWAIPIPRDFVSILGVPIPYNGWTTNLLWLQDVDGSGFDQQLSDEAVEVIRWNEKGAHFSHDVSMVPHTYIPAPFRYVKVTVKTKAPGLIGKVIHRDQQLSHSACGIAWIRPDYWWIDGWWNSKSHDSRDSSWFGRGQIPMKYYRTVECSTWKEGWEGLLDPSNWGDLARVIGEIGELVTEEHSKVSGSVNKAGAKSSLDALLAKRSDVKIDVKSANRPTNGRGRPATESQHCEGESLHTDPWADGEDSSEERVKAKAEEDGKSCKKRRDDREAKEKEAKEKEAQEKQGQPQQAAT